MNNMIAQNVPPNMLIAASQMLLLNTSVFWLPYINELSHFVSSITNDRQPSPSGVDGLKDILAIDAAYKNSI
jgi:predicted dehydrogenase